MPPVTMYIMVAVVKPNTISLSIIVSGGWLLAKQKGVSYSNIYCIPIQRVHRILMPWGGGGSYDPLMYFSPSCGMWYCNFIYYLPDSH